MDQIYVIFKDGEPFKTKHGKNSYTQKRHAKKVITEAAQREIWEDIEGQGYKLFESTVPDDVLGAAEARAYLRYTIEVFKREV